ncbi:serine hydrolase [Lentimicrobium sp. L6]|uniref:serine hydrolase domain-containing protein n=1 Tax=Lentimicrobium sp. L6 TaxID=2735916 RepID=UPI001556D990|nr:serine hydrolase domain-containing protein [Lentimicrobium sp. L6]NPD86034.1 serine hydrolase [Lentimicrobium sp. L6]
MCTKFIPIFFIVSILLITKSFAQKEKIDRYLASCNERGLFNGTALIAKGDSILFNKGFGLANREWNIPNDVDTRFDIGSLTKQFVTVITLQLVEEGKLNVDNVISDFLPKYRKDIGDIVNINHLLKHTSGIKPYVAVRGIDNQLAQTLSKETALEVLHSGDLEFEPGERYRYNNSGMCILVYIIEKITKKAFEDNLKERIFIPLKMKNSGLIKPNKVIEKLASGYILGMGEYTKPKYLNPLNTYGAGGLHSTVEDMFLWNRSFAKHSLLPEKYDEWFYDPYDEFHPGNGHAYSWDITTLQLPDTKKKTKFAHYNGAQWGYLCEMAWIFEGDYTILLFTNIGHNNNIWAVESGIRNILLNAPYKIPLPSLNSVLAKNLNNDTFYKLILDVKNNKTQYSINEQSINMLGYNLLWRNNLTKAQLVFELNTKLFSESSNAFDSLGELYMTIGKKKNAINSFKRSLELNPENKNAKAMLDNLNNK